MRANMRLKLLMVSLAASLPLSSCSLLTKLLYPFDGFFTVFTEWTSEDGRLTVMVQGPALEYGYGWIEVNGEKVLCIVFLLKPSAPDIGCANLGNEVTDYFTFELSKVRGNGDAVDLLFESNSTGDPYYDGRTLRMNRRILDEDEYDIRYFCRNYFYNDDLDLRFLVGEWDDFNRYATYDGRDLTMFFDDGKTFTISEGDSPLSSGTYSINREVWRVILSFDEDSLFGLEGSTLDLKIG